MDDPKIHTCVIGYRSLDTFTLQSTSYSYL